MSSKSGGTIETLSLFRYFYEPQAGDGRQPLRGDHRPRQRRSRSSREEHGFRRVFNERPRHRRPLLARCRTSGIVPGGADGRRHRGAARAARRSPSRPASTTTARRTTRASGSAARSASCAQRGATSSTFAVDEPIGSFGLWVEQLIAESTGKQGKGILPVAGEPLGTPDDYGDDRVFIHLQQSGRARRRLAPRWPSSARPATPCSRSTCEGAERPRPDLLLRRVRHRGRGLGARHQPVRPAERAGGQGQHEQGARRHERGRCRTCRADDDALRELLGGAGAAELRRDHGLRPAVATSSTRRSTELRAAIRDATKATTTFGYGPRFLHSTGQFHKGGPPTGLFLQLVHDGDEDVEIPGAGYTFGTLKNAQATGDLQTLRAHGLPAERVRLEGDAAGGGRAADGEDQGDGLMQIGFVGLGQDGRQHGPPHPARLRPRGRGLELRRAGDRRRPRATARPARRRSRTSSRSSRRRARSG